VLVSFLRGRFTKPDQVNVAARKRNPSLDPAPPADFGDCSEASILAALPSGSELKDFACAVASPALWAAARVTSGSEVYFLKSTSGPWELFESEEICSGAVTGLPDEVLAYCPEG